jgi:hypothetical protein
MSVPESAQSSPPPSPTPAAPGVLVTPGEILWLSLGVWLAGTCLLALMPVILIPRLGMGAGVAASYGLFFLAWQPVQTLTQRAVGARAAVIRMVVFVASAATVGYYLREALLELIRTAAK